MCKLFILFIFVNFHFALSFHEDHSTPTIEVEEQIFFEDDLDFKNLSLAIDRQLKRFSQVRYKGTVKFGNDIYPINHLATSLEFFKKLFDAYVQCESGKAICLERFNQDINLNFKMYKPTPGVEEDGHKEGKTKFTVYYSPELSGSLTSSERFKNPIYAMPSKGLLKYSREDIDFSGVLQNKGLELLWVEDSFYDLFLLHVQGGGKVILNNPSAQEKSEVYISYAGRNKQPFRMLYPYMIEKGYLKKGDAGVEKQRAFIKNNPHLEQEILSQSPSYVFFKITDTEPLGIQNIPLTENRSIALDTRFYPHTGLINFVKAKRAIKNSKGEVEKKSFSRFFLHQDTGGAIKGKARADLYFGFGKEAEFGAYNTVDLGDQYFLIKKK